MYPASTVRDRLGFFNNAAQLRKPAFQIISKIQDNDPADQILATATALVAMCEAIQADPHDVVMKINRAKRHIDGPFSTQYRAIVEYAKGEFK
jgi:hypothetical protein